MCLKTFSFQHFSGTTTTRTRSTILTLARNRPTSLTTDWAKSGSFEFFSIHFRKSSSKWHISITLDNSFTQKYLPTVFVFVFFEYYKYRFNF